MEEHPYIVHSKPINWYVQFYHRIKGSFGFNSIEFRELLERLRINGCKLAENEIEEIYNYTINVIVPPSFIELLNITKGERI